MMTGAGSTERTVTDFMGVFVDVLDTNNLNRKIIGFAQDATKTHKVMYVNAHCLLTAQRDAAYRRILKSAHLVYADGMSVVWASRLMGNRLPGRSTGADFMPGFCRQFAEKGLKIYLLGGMPGVAARASQKMKQISPNLEIVGMHHGYSLSQENGKIIEDINKVKPHILLVGLGVPYQEKWIDENLDHLDVPVVWGVGGLFDFLSGRLRRGPQFLLDHGLEWLCRLFVEPRRLWKRYLVGNFLFVWYLLNWKLAKDRY